MSAIADGKMAAGRAGDGRDRLWRSLEERASPAELRDLVEAEFPALAQRLPWAIDRRTLLKLAGASLSLAGLTACSRAREIVPYVRQPENIIPGKALHYATALSCSGDGYGIGAVVESHEGRPTKVEGNPDHPSSRGGTDAVMQAAVLALFDPDRSRTPLDGGEPASRGAFLAAMSALAGSLEASGGQGAAILIGPTTSPTTKAQIASLRARHPKLRIHRHDPLAAETGEDGAKAVFGRALIPVHRFDRARTVVSLDADFLGEGPGRLAHAHDFAAARRVRGSGDGMSRLYAAETTPTITGAAADHRLGVRPSEIEAVAAVLRDAIAGGEAASANRWVAAAAEDLLAAGSAGLVISGPQQTPFVHAAAWEINARIGAIGNGVALIEPPHAMPLDGDLAALCSEIDGGRIDILVVLGVDPLHTAPADLDVRKTFTRLKSLFHWGLYRDETAALAHWHAPAAHDLESWSDIRGHDGTVSIVQPLIAPLFGGFTIHEMLAALNGEYDADALSLVRRSWVASLDEPAWRKALRDGIVAGSAAQPVAVTPTGNTGSVAPRSAAVGGIELRFVADPWLRDGRHANSPWLQELPRPLTKMVWGNAALLSPTTAARHGLEDGRVVAIARAGREIEAPVRIMPGHPDDTVTLSLGFGRRHGSVAQLAGGYDAFRLRDSGAPWFADGATLTVRDRIERVVTTQHHQTMETRDTVRHVTLETFRSEAGSADKGAPKPEPSPYPQWPYDAEAWAMSIDLTACIGCMACVAACQAENNIATVGPDECALGHEMHWLRVDRYYAGPPQDPDVFFQPVPCMHCENAPCEVVCPVNATVHTHDGLNAQVYNRCIGTRYCSQNCPYKVRRFNFLEYQEFDKESAGAEQAAYNPDVTVRSRGVMEKCTYCVQRIAEKRIGAQIENRAIADGEVVTACQQACPTQAIVFGDLNGKDARVAAEKQAPQHYALLEGLNTRPRTTYLAKIRNASPSLAGRSGGETGDG
jgi:molybdopterin-containing oxidoreductase family iron-sulfur binding subunit